MLEAVPGHPEHEVACLLESSVRQRIWDGLERGQSSVELRRLAKPVLAGEAGEAAQAAVTDGESE
jgi:hypothetical protein